MAAHPPVGAFRRGRLRPPAEAPGRGEHVEPLATLGPVRIEQILSAAAVEPQLYDQDHDEWVVVLDGSATLDVDGEVVELGPGDWLVLPAHVPHRVVRTDAGTTWLAVHAGDVSS